MKLVKTYGVVASHGSKELKLQMIWNENKEKVLALVSYKDGMSVNVTPFTKIEAKTMRELIAEHVGYKPEKKVTPKLSLVTKQKEKVLPENKTVHTLVSITATDINYQTALRNASIEEIKEAIAWMKADDGKHGTRIKFCEQKLNMLMKKSEAEKTPKETTPAPRHETEVSEKKEEETKILQFPTEDKKPKFYQLKTEGDATYEECAEKLGKEKEQFKDADSQYVIDGLIELSKVDQDFRNNIMREDKTYGGCMEYLFKAAKNGYCVRYGNVGWIDRDTGLGLAIEYYNNDEEKIKAEEEAEKKAEAEKRKAEAAKKKTTTKKKTTKTKAKSTPKKGGVIVKSS